MRVGFNRPFAEQAEFLRNKLTLPTSRWDDIERAAHDRAFIVAGAMKADLLADLHGAVLTSIEQGKSIDWFREQFDSIVAKHGWTGWTGEESDARRAWRTRVIYQTNMTTSNAAGRWQQLNDPGLVKLRPYWMYKHADGVLHPRPLHVAWSGRVLPRDHPFWQTHYPPNGWGCHCYVVAVSQKEHDAAVKAGKAQPPEGWDSISRTTGAPVGIDRGFDYAPGARADEPLRNMVADKLVSYPPAITKALSRDVNRYINADQGAADFAREVLADKQRNDPLWLGFVDSFDQVQQATGIDLKGYMVLMPAESVRHVARVHGFDGGDQRPPTAADYNHAASLVSEADSVRTGELVDGKQRLLFIKRIGEETFEAVFEIRPGKRNRALALISLWIKR